MAPGIVIKRKAEGGAPAEVSPSEIVWGENISFIGIRTLSHSVTRGYYDHSPLKTMGPKEEVTYKVMCWKKK